MQEKLLILRKRHNIKQKYIADKLGITVQSYSNKERGFTEFTATEMFIIRDIFGESLEDIFLPRSNRNGNKEKILS